MTDWGEFTLEMERLLKLRSYPISYKRLDNAKDLENIRKVRRLDRFFTFCQLPALVRTRGGTVGVTMDDDINARCSRLHGLSDATKESMAKESTMQRCLRYLEHLSCFSLCWTLNLTCHKA